LGFAGDARPERAEKSGRSEEKMALAVRFPIRIKLLAVISVILVMAQAAVTFLVHITITSDIKKTAWDNNDKNGTLALLESDAVFSALRSQVNVFTRDVALTPDMFDYLSNNLFNQSNENQMETIIAVFFLDNNGSVTRKAINEVFFEENEIEVQMGDTFIQNMRRPPFNQPGSDTFSETGSARYELFNASPDFSGLHILTMSWDNVVMLFSVEALAESFASGANTSSLVNGAGDVLIHADAEMVKSGASMIGDPFVQRAIRSEKGIRDHYKTADGREFFAESHRLKSGDTVVITSIQSDVLFEGIQATTRRNIYFSFCIWFLAVLFIWFFSRSISEPLGRLQAASANIENGYYHIELVSKSKDEIGTLTQSIQSMAHMLQNFEKFTNKYVARLARSGQLSAGGEKKWATIFFSDIRSFTAISETMKAEDVVGLLDSYMESMVACVLMTGGCIDKFIGDAIMAHWGAVESTGSPETDAYCGVRCALMMRAALACFNVGRGSLRKPVIKIGCGLNAGEVIAGQVGSEERSEYTIIGNAVGFADRTETYNKPFGTELLITEQVHNLCGDRFVTEELPAVTQNGQKVRIFTVINVKLREDADEILADLEKVPNTFRGICECYIGEGGPKTLANVRTLIGIPTPDLSLANTDEEEKKYKLKSAG
jgi:adenylate cyclase